MLKQLKELIKNYNETYFRHTYLNSPFKVSLVFNDDLEMYKEDFINEWSYDLDQERTFGSEWVHYVSKIDNPDTYACILCVEDIVRFVSGFKVELK